MFTWPADQLPTVQISLDLEDLDDVLRVAEIALEAGVDWIEAGTPVFAVNGMAGLRALRSEFPEAFLVADMKVIDGGAYFANMVADNGGNAIDIMAAAADPVLTGAVEVGRERGLCILGDLMVSADPVKDARRLERLGVDFVMPHLGADHRSVHQNLSALDGFDAIRRAVKTPIQVVGGLSVEQAEEAVRRGAQSVVIGGPIVPGDRGPKLKATLSRVVEAVKRYRP